MPRLTVKRGTGTTGVVVHSATTDDLNGAAAAAAAANRPVLHNAIDSGNEELAKHLVTNRLVDVNEVAVYSVPSHFPDLYLFPQNLPSAKRQRTVSIRCTPISRAILANQFRAVKMLLEAQATLQGFRELNYSLKNCDPETVQLLLDRFSDEELRDHKIEGQWALHAYFLAKYADRDEREGMPEVHKTRPIISRYVRAGWDINTLTPAELSHTVYIIGSGHYLSRFSLLHLACKLGDIKLISALVELGADVNQFTGNTSELECTPLQLAILENHWGAADYLVDQGSNVEIEGCWTEVADKQYLDRWFSRFTGFTRVIRKRLMDSPGNSKFNKFNAFELVLKSESRHCVPLFDKILSKVTRIGADELHLAVDGGNLDLITKVFQLGKPYIVKEDLLWIDFESPSYSTYRSPLLSHVFEQILVYRDDDISNNTTAAEQSNSSSVGRRFKFRPWCSRIADFLQDVVAQGYNPNLVNDMGDSLIFQVLGFALRYDEDNVLLKTLLKFENFQINVRNGMGESPVTFALREWEDHCDDQHDGCCRPDGRQFHLDTIKLLLQNGADVSTLNIGDETKCHPGYGEIIKLLCRGGAKVKGEFFEDPLCGRPNEDTRREVEALKEWVLQDGKGIRLNLKAQSRATIRRSLRRTRDTAKLNRLAPSEQEYVAMKYEV